MTVLTAPDAPPAGHLAVVDVWTPVCRLQDLEPERGVAALVEGRHVAVCRTWDDGVHALDHRDPFKGPT